MYCVQANTIGVIKNADHIKYKPIVTLALLSLTTAPRSSSWSKAFISDCIEKNINIEI